MEIDTLNGTVAVLYNLCSNLIVPVSGDIVSLLSQVGFLFQQILYNIQSTRLRKAFPKLDNNNEYDQDCG